MNRTQSTALLRALAAVSWADGRLERAEESHLKRLAYRLGLDPDDLHREIQPLLAHPISYDRAMEIVGDLTRVLGSAADRELFLTELRRLFEADGDFSQEERDIVAEVEAALVDYGAVDFLIGRLRGAFGPLLDTRRRTSTVSARDLGPFANNRVLARLLERLRDEGIETSQDIAALNRATLEGVILTRVATAGGEVIDDRGTAMIRRLLHQQTGLEGPEMEETLATLCEGADATMDRQRLCAELNRVSTMAERQALVRAMFRLAGPGASGAVHEEIRLMANFLWVPTRDFVEIRQRETAEEA